MLTLRLLGNLDLSSSGDSLGPGALQRRPLALLAIITVAGSRGVSRDQALLYLWPESSAKSAKSALNQTLYVLRRDLREPNLLIPGTVLRLNPTVFKCDHWGFEQALSRRELEQAVAHYSGPFLDQFSLGRIPEFDRWVTNERSRLFERYYQALITLAERASDRGEHRDSIKWWRMLSAQDPFSAGVAGGLITALAADGDRSGALRFANEYESRLRSELDMNIDPRIAELIRHMREVGSEGPPMVTGFQVRRLLDDDHSEESFAHALIAPPPHVAEAGANSRFAAPGLSFEEIVESSVDVIYLTDLSGRFTYANAAGAKLLETNLHQIIGRLFIDFVRDDFRLLLFEFYARQIQQNTFVTYFEFPVITASGTTLWLGQRVQIFERDGVPAGMLSIARDITLSKNLRGSQSYFSVRDSVTKLLNAAAFRVVVDYWIALAERNQQGFILVFISLEDIEAQLTSHGPAAAEVVLGIVADALRASFRKSDVVARVRPDKFAVLALYAIEADARILENRVRENLDELLAAHPDVLRPSLRVTAAFYDPAMPPSLDALFASVALADPS